MNNLSKAIARALGVPRPAASPARRRPRGFIPAVEALTERLAPAVLAGGVLYIHGTNAQDVVSVTNGTGTIKVTENGRVQSFSRASVTGNVVAFWGYDGN